MFSGCFKLWVTFSKAEALHPRLGLHGSHRCQPRDGPCCLVIDLPRTGLSGANFRFWPSRAGASAPHHADVRIGRGKLHWPFFGPKLDTFTGRSRPSFGCLEGHICHLAHLQAHFQPPRPSEIWIGDNQAACGRWPTRSGAGKCWKCRSYDYEWLSHWSQLKMRPMYVGCISSYICEYLVEIGKNWLLVSWVCLMVVFEHESAINDGVKVYIN